MLHYFKLILAFIILFSLLAEAKPKKKNGKCPETTVTMYYKIGQKKARKIKNRKSVSLHHCVVDKQFRTVDDTLLDLWATSKSMKTVDATVSYHFGKWGLRKDSVISYVIDANATRHQALTDEEKFKKTIYIDEKLGNKLVRFETSKVSITLQHDNNKIVTYHVK